MKIAFILATRWKGGSTYKCTFADRNMTKHYLTQFVPKYFFSLKKKFSTFKREVCRTACAKEGLPCISRLCKFFWKIQVCNFGTDENMPNQYLMVQQF